MEINGIGTDGSIPVHIEKICARNFVKVCKGDMQSIFGN